MKKDVATIILAAVLVVFSLLTLFSSDNTAGPTTKGQITAAELLFLPTTAHYYRIAAGESASPGLLHGSQRVRQSPSRVAVCATD
jgi:hypothetical protein